jgi:hypothetical protein
MAVTPGRAEENHDVELADVPVRDVRPLLAGERPTSLLCSPHSTMRIG